MNTDEIVRRLAAFHQGRPLPLGKTMHFPVARQEDILIVAFARMGGESLPWGIGYGHPNTSPTILTVPEPRNRDLVAEMAAQLAPVLLKHFWHPDSGSSRVTDPQQVLPLRQVWLPNPTHLDMLHFLAYTYTFTKWGEPARVVRLNALGRLSNWLFQEAHRPGQVVTMVATETLRESFTFPAETTRQGHLGFLLAWLEAKGGREARLTAASAAERLPIATTLDPEFERSKLEPVVQRHNDASRSGDERAAKAAVLELSRRLEPELRRRFELTQRAIQILKSDKRPLNAGVAQLITASHDELWSQYLRLELKRSDGDGGPLFVPSPETDRHPAAAASRYMAHEASADLHAAALLHHDVELQSQAIAAGDAFRGRITAVRDEGQGRATRPIWTIESEQKTPLRLREGSDVCVAGLPNRTGRVRSITALPNRGYRFDVEITGLKTTPRTDLGQDVRIASDPKLKGTVVTFVKPSMEGLSRRRSFRVWKKDGPGAWLTHGVPKGAKANVPEEIAEDLQAIDEALEP